MASQANSTLRVHFHDTVNINILPPLQQNLDSGWNEPLPEPYINISLGSPNHNASSSAPDNSHTTAFHQVFLRSKPRFRGITQIFVAHFQLALGIALNFVGGNVYTLHSYIIFWGPPFLICSGMLAVAAHSIVSTKLVRVSNVFHTISILIILTGLVLSCIDIFTIYPCGIKCANMPINPFKTLPFFTFLTLAIFANLTGVSLCGNNFGTLLLIQAILFSRDTSYFMTVLGTMAIASFVVMTNILQLSLSSYIVYYGFHSLNYILETPPQTRANENLGFVLPDPPAYSETTFHVPPPFPQPPPCPSPPPYTHSSPAYSPPPFSEVADYSQPPPYSE